MVTVQSTSDTVSAYKELLLSDWTRSFPHDVLALLWEALGGEAVTNGDDPLLRLLDPNKTTSFPQHYFRSIVLRIADGTKFVKLAELPEFPTNYVPPKKFPNIVRQASQLATYLTLPAHTTVTGNTEFFMDILALAFQATLHFVLPDLRTKHADEHSLLLHSAMLFSISYSAYEPSHYAYMMSMIHGYLGDEDQQLRSLFASFRFTSPEDHSYLTKAQEFWAELLDRNKYKEAESFLFSLYWWSLPSQQDEIREMVVDAFKYILTANRNQR